MSPFGIGTQKRRFISALAAIPICGTELCAACQNDWHTMSGHNKLVHKYSRNGFFLSNRRRTFVCDVKTQQIVCYAVPSNKYRMLRKWLDTLGGSALCCCRQSKNEFPHNNLYQSSNQSVRYYHISLRAHLAMHTSVHNRTDTTGVERILSTRTHTNELTHIPSSCIHVAVPGT